VHEQAVKRERIFGELDDLFNQQFLRITSAITNLGVKRRQHFRDADEGPLIPAESQTLCLGGDEFEYEDR
jgi:hypothetical protein